MVEEKWGKRDMTVNFQTIKRWLSRLLLGFVLVTVGFAAGRRTASQSSSTGSEDSGIGDSQSTQSDQVVVYAAHMTFRCPECNQIEWLARELVDAEFAAEIEAGRLEFRTVDYMKNIEFARHYNISSSTIVVVRFEESEEQGFKRLDEVWTKVKNREAFFEYVRTAIRDSLEQGGEA